MLVIKYFVFMGIVLGIAIWATGTLLQQPLENVGYTQRSVVIVRTDEERTEQAARQRDAANEYIYHLTAVRPLVAASSSEMLQASATRKVPGENASNRRRSSTRERGKVAASINGVAAADDHRPHRQERRVRGAPPPETRIATTPAFGPLSFFGL